MTLASKLLALIFIAVCGSASAQEVARSFTFPLADYQALVTQRFGTPNPDYYNKPHAADDLEVPATTVVVAAASGTVRFAQRWRSCPNWEHVVVIEHVLPDGTFVNTIYGHLEPASVAVAEGATVVLGQPIGRVGQFIKIDGRPCWKDHLHFGVRVGPYGSPTGQYPDWLVGYLSPDRFPDTYVDPFTFVSDRSTAATTVRSASCSAPIVGQTMTCSIFGTNLPSTASFTATNCTPSPMAAAPGGTGSQRQFTCVPQQAGVLVQASYVVPGFLGPLPEVSFTPFSEQFAGTSFDTSKWSSVGSGVVTVSDDVANFACRSSLSTQGKYVIAGETIVIEARMAGTGPLRDTVFALYELDGTSLIQAGDTNYRGVGLYLFGTGSFALAQTGNGTSTSAFKEYRLTLSGRSAKIERGDTLNAITESVTRDLPNSISGRTFHLLVGTGGPDYCPGSVDWIKVTPR